MLHNSLQAEKNELSKKEKDDSAEVTYNREYNAKLDRDFFKYAEEVKNLAKKNNWSLLSITNVIEVVIMLIKF